jgi:hypothetical protein
VRTIGTVKTAAELAQQLGRAQELEGELDRGRDVEEERVRERAELRVVAFGDADDGFAARRRRQAERDLGLADDCPAGVKVAL